MVKINNRCKQKWWIFLSKPYVFFAKIMFYNLEDIQRK